MMNTSLPVYLDHNELSGGGGQNYQIKWQVTMGPVGCRSVGGMNGVKLYLKTQCGPARINELAQDESQCT